MRDVAESGRGTVGVDGSAIVALRGPHRNLSRWSLSSVVVTSTPPTGGGYPTARVYRSTVSDATLLGLSRAADRVTFDATGDWLHQGDQLIVIVENAEPATAVTVNLYATEGRAA